MILESDKDTSKQPGEENEKSTEIYAGVKETVRKDIHGIWMKVWRIPQAGGREA